MEDSLAQFWVASDRIFELAAEGKEGEAREEIRASLQPRVAALSTAVSRLLVANNESEQQAVEQVEQIYDGVQRQVYLFLVATLIAIVLTSVYLIRLNRRLFATYLGPFRAAQRTGAEADRHPGIDLAAHLARTA